MAGVQDTIKDVMIDNYGVDPTDSGAYPALNALWIANHAVTLYTKYKDAFTQALVALVTDREKTLIPTLLGGDYDESTLQAIIVAEVAHNLASLGALELQMKTTYSL